jgi:hypothetical protein
MEKAALHEYLYNTWMSGDISVGGFANTGLMHAGAWARSPLLARIPKLAVPNVSFVYGESDWMRPINGACVIVHICVRVRVRLGGYGCGCDVVVVVDVGVRVRVGLCVSPCLVQALASDAC